MVTTSENCSCFMPIVPFAACVKGGQNYFYCCVSLNAF